MRNVGVLVFVDQDEFEAALIISQHVRVLAEQTDVFQQQIAEIGGVEDLQPLLIARIELAALAVGKHRGFARRHLRRPEPAVLPAVDQAGQHPRRPALVVDAFGLKQLLEQPYLVVGIEHGEIGFELHHLGMGAQDAPADGVEGAEPRHAFDRLAEHLAEPQFHLARGLVGEGHREDFARTRPALAEDMGDAAGQDAGLAGTGAGQHQYRTIQRFHCLALLGIEAVEIRGRCRRPGARGNPAGQRLVVGDARVGQVARLGHVLIRFPPTMARSAKVSTAGSATKGSLHSRNEAHIGRGRLF